MARQDMPIRHTMSRVRLALHVITALIAWAVFVWAWYVVFFKRTSDQTLHGVLALGVFLVAMLLLTLGWVRHNLLIYRRKGPRLEVPMVREDWSRDVMGRAVVADWQRVRRAGLVVVEPTETAKRYRVEVSDAGTFSEA